MASELSKRFGSTTVAANDNSAYEHQSIVNEDWVFESIDLSNWNKSYPYELRVLDASKGYSPAYGWTTFTLPIPPTELVIGMPSGVNISATLGGIIEEHSGARFRIIAASGTTGVTPLRGRAGRLGAKSSVQAVFGGTISRSQKIAADAKTLVNSTGLPQADFNLITETEGDKSIQEFQQSTGYYQFLMLQRFLEQYLTAKKEGGKNLRLAFCIKKDAATYLVTPLDFTVRRNAQSPLEYLYNLQFKAYKRITIHEDTPNAPSTSDADAKSELHGNPNNYQQLLNRIQAARKILHDAQDLVKAAQTDIQGVIEIAREVAFALKDGLGVAMALADLPANVIQSATDAWYEITDTLRQINDFSFQRGSRELKQNTAAAARLSGKTEVGAGHAKSLPNAVDKALADPTRYYDLLNEVKLGDLKLRSGTVKLVSTERQRIRALTRLDYETRRDMLVQTAADFADNVGAGSSAFNETYARKTPTSTRTPTDRDYDVMFAMNEVVNALNYFAASGRINDTVSAVEYVAGLATQSGTAFRVPKSKFAVPFPFGATLPRLAATYLGDPERWMEIATLNGLHQPYTDETGFALPLITQSSGNQVQVTDASNLYVGQAVWLQSNTVTPTKRHITVIRNIAASVNIITVDGAVLPQLSPNDSATLHAFLPNTVNSQMMIYIPSDKDVDGEDLQTKSIPGINLYDNLIRTGGVDVLLTPNGDWAITPDGDCRLAVGLTNLVQQVRIALGTAQGSLLMHPSFGLPVTVGESVADVSATQLLSAARNLFKDDPAFTGVKAASVSKQGPVTYVSIGVQIAGANDLLPITVAVPQ